MVSPAPGCRDSGEDGGKAEWLIYAFVARGIAVLAEYTEFTGNFPAIAAQCLQRLPAGSSSASTGPDGRGGAPVRFSYACDGHTFNFLLHRGYGEIRSDQSMPFKSTAFVSVMLW
jgi:vesicle-associated membrane protein 72